MSVTKIHTREELEQKREEYRKALNAQKKQILICGGNRLRRRRLFKDL